MATTTNAGLVNSLRNRIAGELRDLIAIRHDLHAHPELGYAEQRTSSVVKRELGEAGVEFVDGLAGGTGVLAHLSGSAAKATALRADMDALPITEETGAVYASTNPGVMHACGHDGHTTILLGAARVLSGIAKEHGLPRPVSFIFQPAEEGGAGGKRMVEEGCLNGSCLGPPVEHVFGLHGWPQHGIGTAGTRPGPLLAASDEFNITIRGAGAHAAYPHVSRDPIVAAASIVTALQTLASRNVNPIDAIVVSVTQFHAGTAFNIIPDTVHLGGTVRTLTPEVHGLARRRLREITSGVAQGLGCEAQLEYRIGYPVTLNDPTAVDIFNAAARSALGIDNVVHVEHPTMGGEDFAFYCHAVPSCFFFVGLVPPGEDAPPQLHQAKFDFNDDAIAIGVELFCRLALRA